MLPKLVKTNKVKNTPRLMLILKSQISSLKSLYTDVFSDDEIDFISKQSDKDIDLFRLPRLLGELFVHLVKEKENEPLEFDSIGALFYKAVSKYKFEEIQFVFSGLSKSILSYTEGFILTSYVYNKYKSEKQESFIKKIAIVNKEVKQSDLNFLTIVCKNVFLARDLVNEPGSELDSVEFAKRISKIAIANACDVEVFHKAKISSLKMGGLLAINRGSKIPPTFSIVKWKPDESVNQQPLVIVGKGIVFDTGGLSLKPTANSMDYMKSDMSGAAIALSVISAIAELKLPLYVIVLLPATDNRPGENAILPGDVVKMYNGSTVEVLNTDAEGRMILADALSFAAQYQPELVIDMATLTGAAAVALGKYAMAAFFKCDETTKQQLLTSGFETNEKMVEFPLWNEYAELIKSDIADLKNIGGRDAGAITAAKFLEKFTSYPWIHLDIAGVSFTQSDFKFYPKGGTGFGMRVLLHFIIKKYLTK